MAESVDLELPYKYESLTKEQLEKRGKIFGEKSIECTMKKIVPGDIWVPKEYDRFESDIRNFEVRPDDVWIITYPKCGTTWTQEIVWDLMHGINDEEKRNILERSPFIEVSAIFSSAVFEPPKEGAPKREKKEYLHNTLEYANNLKSPRMIKTHLPMEILPKNLLNVAKVIFVCRNPLDTCVSYYNHCLLGENVYRVKDGDHLLDYSDLFLDGDLLYGDYFYHLKSGLKRRNHPNMKFIWFEEMKKDQVNVIKDLADFIGCPVTDEKAKAIIEHTSLASLRKKAIEGNETGKFFRKGVVGDWKNYFQGERLEKWKRVIAEKTRGLDVKIEFE